MSAPSVRHIPLRKNTPITHPAATWNALSSHVIRADDTPSELFGELNLPRCIALKLADQSERTPP